MKAWFPLLLTCGVFASVRAWAHIDEPDIAADCQKVASYAELGKKAYQRQDYAKAADIFRDQAAWSEFCGLERVLRPERAGCRHGLQQRGVVADARRRIAQGAGLSGAGAAR